MGDSNIQAWKQKWYTYTVSKQVCVFSSCCMSCKYIPLKWLCLCYHLWSPLIMEDQGTDVCFALLIFVYADFAKCICLELSEFGALWVFYSVHPRMQAVNAGHRCVPPTSSVRPVAERKWYSLIPYPVLFARPYCFPKSKISFHTVIKSWHSQNLSMLLHAGHASFSCLIDPGG